MKRKAFTIIELLLVISVIVLLMAILLPTVGKVMSSSRAQRSGVQISNITRAMINYAEGNDGWFPGMAPDGTVRVTGGTLFQDPLWRFRELVRGDFIQSELFYSPAESNNTKVKALVKPASFTSITLNNFSYSMLKITSGATSPSKDYDRNAEWRNNTNGYAAVMSDRGDANLDGTTGDSIYEPADAATGDKGNWRGHVAWGDGSVTFEGSRKLRNRPTTYNGNTLQASGGTMAAAFFEGDDLFDENDDGGQKGNAVMVHRTTGNTINNH